MSLGLEHGVNRVVPYSADWPNKFTAESKRIINVCGEHILAVEHVGSTSIENLTAKPIIDIALAVETLEKAELMISGMASIGYDYPGYIGIPGDRIFGRDPGFRKFLAHVVVLNEDQWNNYIMFRDALREDKKLVEEYGNLKSEIIKKHPEGRAIYTELKSDFVNRVLRIHS